MVKRRVAPKALGKMKERVREITDRNGGRSMKSVFAELRGYLTGWKEYFCLAETPRVLSDLDEWIRHRLRMVQLKQWKRGKTIYREMTRLGAAGMWPAGWRPTRDAGGRTPPSCSTPACPTATTTEWECRDLRRNLNFPNRRMPHGTSGGVAGE